MDILSTIALLSGILVISIKNPINALICLIALFGIISVYLIFCGLDYIGFSYLIVYIGAVSILFLFILMLISIRTSELQSNNSNSIPLGLFTLIILDYILIETIPYNLTINSYMSGGNSGNIYNEFLTYGSYKENYISYLSTIFLPTEKINIMYITSNSWDGNIAETGHITAIGDILYTSYNIWLILASLILLLAMVGSIIITIKQEDKKGNYFNGRIFVLHTKG
uniref:NADH dehydrogenase subunit 6 n=1 Tax=Stachybotrys echinatus TaxID=80383 RepID=UPI001EDDAC91|nr:NADH dehydrogenase subunit 6 [Stachybotrys echinatus]UIX25775.1 NADH dehydrogenase subunit 6 [Stachybotrys echinatus]